MGGDVIILEIRQPNCMPFRRTCEGLRQRLHIQIEHSANLNAKRLLGCFHQQPLMRVLELALFGCVQSIAVESFYFATACIVTGSGSRFKLWKVEVSGFCLLFHSVHFVPAGR